ncbi:MAG: DUF4011 domain-containing protein [Acidobacteriota bacterium]|nr:MAG: DUF4011 domain-containing protein [Acidobacteriota bacterium]
MRKKLLDLTARNSLINFRHTKGRSLRVIDELPNQLVSSLLDENEMRFEPIPEPRKDQLIKHGYLKLDGDTGEYKRVKKSPNATQWGKILGFSTDYEVPREDEQGNHRKHLDNAIQTLLYPNELETRLKTLHRNSESAIQETGANILYIAFGFLEWFEKEVPQPRLAPLYLVPVRLNKGRLNNRTKTYEYTLQYSGEDIVENLSLREKLREDFRLELPELSADLEPEQYFDELARRLRGNKPSWSVRRNISLALLDFSKLLMYLDLDDSRWPDENRLLDHELVKTFLEGLDSEEDKQTRSSAGKKTEWPIDEIDQVHDRYPLIDDADSSQHSALIDAIDGQNLVIEGPPGTGKSQTITNLIAAAMARGNRVLFVAEKLAALEVVYRRLESAGLGEFCLELHSHKSRKKTVIEEIDKRLRRHGRLKHPESLNLELAESENLKDALKAHVERVNRTWKSTGRTVHEILMAATHYRRDFSNPSLYHPTGYNGDNFDPSVNRRLQEQISVFLQTYSATKAQVIDSGSILAHPWSGVTNTRIQGFDTAPILSSLSQWQDSLEQLDHVLKQIESTINGGQREFTSLTAAQNLLGDLSSIGERTGKEYLFVLGRLRGGSLETSKNYAQSYSTIQHDFKLLLAQIRPEVLSDLDRSSQLSRGSRALRELVSETVTLEKLLSAREELERLCSELERVRDSLSRLSPLISQEAARLLSPTLRGQDEFSRILRLSSELGPEDWSSRDSRFDNEELDTILPKLRSELESLHKLHSRLQMTFHIEKLPSETELIRIRLTLEDAGFFRWFSKEWRAARKKLFGLRISKKIKLNELRSELLIGSEYMARYKSLKENSGYKDALGDLLNGLDTDIARLERVRQWYRNVRAEFGVGFGERVFLGDALLKLTNETLRGLKSLNDQGTIERVEWIKNTLSNLKGVLLPLGEIDEETGLVGDNGSVSKLQRELSDTMAACGTVALRDSISVVQLTEAIEAMSELKGKVDGWKSSSFDQDVFGGVLDLQIGPTADSSDNLERLRDTNEFASRLETRLGSQSVRDYVYVENPEDRIRRLETFIPDLRRALDDQENAYRNFAKTVDLDPEAWFNVSGDDIDQLLGRNERALKNGDLLGQWIGFMRTKKDLSKAGLATLVKLLVNSQLGERRFLDAYLAGVYDLLSREILSEEPELENFSGLKQNTLREEFSKIDHKLKELQRKKIAWRIDQNQVVQGNRGARVSEHTERFLLEHECNKKTRHIPIRQLLLRASSALTALKPCFMMGPMSVAHYLAPGRIQFDLVVMDEASQIKPQDALGAVARGGRLVVVGDPKQLPPTSFFERTIKEEEEDPTALEESESILDATIPIFPRRTLRWHYRSRHESLIAFSNHHFYERDLVLFPSPHKATGRYGVRYTRVPGGYFVSGRNTKEAQVIAEAVREHFKSAPNESLGVVAMNIEQRAHIEDAIEALAKEDPAFYSKLQEDKSREEPMFIKNLENVQGDERDVIYISMTYGPRELGGRVSQNFGPINSDSGWRRLNVLFTRSKLRMHVFSSMGSGDVELSENSSGGVRALKEFLAYCNSTHNLENEILEHSSPDTAASLAIRTMLNDAGYQCDTNVGVAGHFIDIAVKDPGQEGMYLLGIEFDGRNYISAKSVRDRDRLRSEVLRRLDWDLHRIWSVDWYRNPRVEFNSVLHKLQTIVGQNEGGEHEDDLSELNRIGEVISESRRISPVLARIMSERNSLTEKLIRFNELFVEEESANIPQNKRILRPSMIEAFDEYRPSSKSEYFERIPLYLREGTEASQYVFLEDILEIVGTSTET